MTSEFSYTDAWEEHEACLKAIENGTPFVAEPPIDTCWTNYMSCYDNPADAIAHAKRIEGIAYMLSINEDDEVVTNTLYVTPYNTDTL